MAADRRAAPSGAFNANWDADWTVQAQVTERGWEAELAIPLKTLRYDPGTGKTWGFNAMRIIRRKNEQVYLQPVPRGYNLTRVSEAAQLTGLELPKRRDLKLTPYVAGRYLEDNRFTEDPSDGSGDVGLDLKWGITPSLTADVTVNTDFAQVEADEEQVNLTRFELFFPEKRPVLPRERLDLPVRGLAADRPLLLAARRLRVGHRGADPRRRPGQRQGRGLQRRRHEHPDARDRRRPH